MHGHLEVTGQLLGAGSLSLMWVPGIKLRLSLVAGDCLLIDHTSSGRFNAVACHTLSDIWLGFDGI